MSDVTASQLLKVFAVVAGVVAATTWMDSRIAAHLEPALQEACYTQRMIRKIAPHVEFGERRACPPMTGALAATPNRLGDP